MKKAEPPRANAQVQPPRQGRADAVEGPQAEEIEQAEAVMESGPQFEALRKPKEMIDNSPRAAEFQKIAGAMHNSPMMVTQRKKYEDLFKIGTPVTTPQAAGPFPIQRKLTVEGSKEKVGALLELLGKPAGLRLKADEKTNLVTAESVDEKPKSPTLRGKLLQMIDDGSKTAQVKVDVDEDVEIGAFPKNSGDAKQSLNVPNLVAAEEGEPGAGAAMAFHEIWENYSAQSSEGTVGPYKPAHEAAMIVESKVAAEISERKGERVADCEIDGVMAFDYTDYFLVFEFNKGTAKRIVPEIVSTHTLTHCADGNDAVTEADEAAVKAAASRLEAVQLTTVWIRGFKKASEAAGLGLARANAVLPKLSVEDRDRCYVVDGGVADEAGVEIMIRKPKGDWKSDEKGPVGDSDDETEGKRLETKGGLDEEAEGDLEEEAEGDLAEGGLEEEAEGDLDEGAEEELP